MLEEEKNNQENLFLSDSEHSKSIIEKANIEKTAN